MAKRPSQKRDLVKPTSGARYAKRRSDGTFKEMDDAGRAQKADRRTAARTAVTSGYGDQGDRARKAPRTASHSASRAKGSSAGTTKRKADPGALRGFSDVETPQKPGRRMKTAAKSGYANLIPRRVRKA